MPPNEDLTWSTVEECQDFGSRMVDSAKDTLGSAAGHLSWWCIPLSEDWHEGIQN